MQSNFNNEPGDIALQLLTAAENFSGNNLSDDVAIVVVKYPAQNSIADYGKLAQASSGATSDESTAYENGESNFHTAA
jgi:hypothetical protein